MENQQIQERTVPIQYVRGSRGFRQFLNPPQPHMCIQDTIRDTSQKIYVNVLGWQKISKPKQYSDIIPLYGGMPVPQGCGPNSRKPPLLVFAVMVNPEILKANGKNSPNPSDRDALVSLLCEFVEAMNPGLLLSRNPVILKDRDLAGELKDVWLAVKNKREREEKKGANQDVMYKVYDIDGIGNDQTMSPCNDDKCKNPRRQCDDRGPNNHSPERTVKSSKQILLNAGQKSEFDSGMNNCQLNQNQCNRDNKCGNSNDGTTYCTPVYGQIVSSRENHNEINDIQQKLTSYDNKPSGSFKKEENQSHSDTEGWDEYSKQMHQFKNSVLNKCNDDSPINQKGFKANKPMSNGKSHYDFYPVFDNKNEVNATEESGNDEDSLNVGKESELRDNDNTKVIVEPMQKLVLHTTDSKICDNSKNVLGSVSS